MAKKYNANNLPAKIQMVTNGREEYVTHLYINVPDASKPNGIGNKLFVVTYDLINCKFRKPTAWSDFLKYHKKRKVGTGKAKWTDEQLDKYIEELTNGELVYVYGSFYTNYNSQQVVTVTDIFGNHAKETTLGALRLKYKKG